MAPADLLAIRKRLGLNQTDFAARLGVNRVTVARWETGTRTIDPLTAAGIRAVLSAKSPRKQRVK